MSDAGRNLPFFRSVQLDFADHIRNPAVNPLPADIEPRRMQIYVDLFFNNIRNFLDSAFPVSREIVGEQRWLALVREFVHLHPSESPFFLQISEEFMTFLYNRGMQDLPAFLLELCHYEWVELSLDVAADQPPQAVQPDGSLDGHLVLNPYMRALAYEYAVHKIGAGHLPQEGAPAAPTYLIVYRNTRNKVRFVESNPVTHRLLALLPDRTAAEALTLIHEELQSGGRQVEHAQVYAQGMQTLTRLRSQGIILGSS